MVNGTSVFAYDGLPNKQPIVDFAREGWKKATALGFLSSPFSAIGRTKGVILAVGGLLLDLHE